MDYDILEEIDRGGIHSIYDKWPQLARSCYSSDINGIELGEISHVVFAGMGGSGTISDVFASILSKTGVHVEVVKGYQLPRTADPESLVVATSISGNTEETLSVLTDAAETGCQVAAFSDGGRMEEICGRRGLVHRRIPMTHSPRASLPVFLYSMLRALEPFLPVKRQDVIDSLDGLEEMSRRISSSSVDEKNPAVLLAKWLSDIPLIYYPRGLQAAAVRFKNSLQENAKMHAMAENVIEACHNGIVAWGSRSAVRPVLIQGADDHRKTRERWIILKELLAESGVEYREVHSTGGGILGKLIGLIYLLDYTTIYRAVMSGVDPTQVYPINFVKERLKGCT